MIGSSVHGMQPYRDEAAGQWLPVKLPIDPCKLTPGASSSTTSVEGKALGVIAKPP
jgi:hypothetical protein